MPNIKFYLLFLSLLMVSGCAIHPQDGRSQKIDRISEEELMRIIPKPVATLSLDDLVRLTKDGVSANQIIDKIKSSNSSYDLTPSQSVELNKQGVDSVVLDYIHASRESAMRNNIADEINQREKIRRAELDKLKRQQWLERHQPLYDPICGYGYHGFYPYRYGTFGPNFGRRSGVGLGFSMPLDCW
jgi:hypothetical protein